MLTENQEIIYRKNGSEIGRITSESELPESFLGYIRYYQPFTKKGCILAIPKGRQEIRTSKVTDVKRKENVLVVKTLNSVYEIEYKGINLERVLKDGEFKGVNKSEGTKITLFPKK